MNQESEELKATMQVVRGLNCYILALEGKGVEKNYEEAAKCFRKAAAQGHAVAHYYLGQMYWHGRGVPRDDLVALQWTQNAVELGHDEARAFLERAHEFMVTEMEAEKGDPKALYKFGQMCFDDEVAPQGYEDDGLEWILEAAQGGCVEAQLWMADYLTYGGTNTSEYAMSSAVFWIWEAAKQGNADAQFQIADMHYEGKVVPKNFIESYAWHLLSQANENSEASEKEISDLEKRLTAEGIEKGQARAAELQRSFGAE